MIIYTCFKWTQGEQNIILNMSENFLQLLPDRPQKFHLPGEQLW